MHSDESIEDLIKKDDLTSDELKKVPACAATSLLAYIDYCKEKLEITSDQLLNGVSVKYEYIKDNRNWVNAYDTRIFKSNVKKYADKLITHYDYREIGQYVVKQKKSLLIIMGMIVPVEILVKSINKIASRFNNEYTLESIFIKNYALITIKDFNYFKRADLGWACYFVMGVIEGPFLYQKYKYVMDHVVCGKNILSIIENNYEELKYEEKNTYIYINGVEIGKKIRLIKENIGIRMEYLGRYVDGEPYNAILITEDVFYKERKIFKKGEIYNAPYCVLRISWKKGIVSKIITGPINTYYKMISFETLSRQLEFSNQKLLEAEQNAERAKKAKIELEELNLKLETKVQERTSELIKAKELIEQQSKEKTDFFINLAHETRTPATLIQNYLNKCVLRYPNDTDLVIVKKYLDKLINDMVNFLDTEKIVQGRLRYDERHKFNLKEYIENKIDLIKATADKKRIKIIQTINNDINITTNIHALDRILNNLLDNALRYTPNYGSISIEIEKEVKTNFINIAIKDTGPGIPEDNKKHIFERFYQISHSKGNNQGIGMGLFITKGIIESLGGSISIITDNESIIGSKFLVKLPDDQNGQDVSIKDICKNYQNKNIITKNKNIDIFIDDKKDTVLLVEDNEELLIFIKESLNEKYNTLCAKNGREALELVKNNRISIIVSDIMMDIMDGYELLQKIKEKNEYKDIPFVFLTAKTGQNEEIKGLKSGAIEYIQKPFSIEVLKERINSLIEFNKLKKATLELEKYHSVGMMVASICHEILNPLSGIQGPLYVIERNLKEENKNEDKTFSEGIRHIKNNIERITNVVNTMRSLFNGDEYQIEEFDLNPIIKSIISINSDKSLYIKYELLISESFLIRSNKSALTQILMNIISNAAESISGNGKITITGINNGMKQIRIRDTGCGINPEIIPRIFDLAFTTKSEKGGTGLGLYIAKELADKLKIRISIDTEINKGTEFALQFE